MLLKSKGKVLAFKYGSVANIQVNILIIQALFLITFEQNFMAEG